MKPPRGRGAYEELYDSAQCYAPKPEKSNSRTKREHAKLPSVDEFRKRVIGIMASILAVHTPLRLALNHCRFGRGQKRWLTVSAARL